MRPGRAADNSPPSSAAVMEEYSYTSTHPLGHTGPVTGPLYCSHVRPAGSSLAVNRMAALTAWRYRTEYKMFVECTVFLLL